MKKSSDKMVPPMGIEPRQPLILSSTLSLDVMFPGNGHRNCDQTLLLQMHNGSGGWFNYLNWTQKHLFPIYSGWQSLPPANEVWGKVIFSEACVKNSVRGGVPGSRGVWSRGCGPREGGPGGMPGRGVVPGGCPVWVVSGPGGVPGGDPPGTATAAGGTHPTGMYSCF